MTDEPPDQLKDVQPADQVKEALSKLRLGPCRLCGRDVTEADDWNADGPLDAYPPVKTTVYHLTCLYVAGLGQKR